MKKIMLIMALLLVIDLAFAIHLNEIMYNPSGNDNNQEFVEVKGTHNLSSFMIGDLAFNDSLELLYYFPSNFSLIIEEGFDYSDLNCSVYSVGATIGDNLDNNGDTLFLYFNGTLVDNVSYTSDLAYGNNHSLELVNSNWIESFYEGGSPCMENYIGNTTNESVNETVEVNETVNVSCNFTLSIYVENILYNNNEQIKFYNLLSEELEEYIIEYRIEDLFGDVIRVRNTSNLNAKSFTPSIDEKEKAFVFMNKLVVPNCSNITSQEYVIVKNNITEDEEEKETESSIMIKEIYLGQDNSAEFGESFRVKVYIYKGKTGKTSVKAYVQDHNGDKISETTSFNVYKQYTENELSFPVQLLPNCKSNFHDDNYELIVEGLDVTEKQDLVVEGSNDKLCVEVEKECAPCPSSSSSSSYFVSKSTADENVTEYELLNITQVDDKVLSKVKIRNKEEEALTYEIYSYVYQGSKCYSESRTENIMNLTLEADEERIIELDNTFFGEPGTYKVKVRIKKDYRKTYDELTGEVAIVDREEVNETTELEPELLLPSIPATSEKTNKITGQIVYSSKSEKVKKYIKYLIVLPFVIGGILYFRKNGKKRNQEKAGTRLDTITCGVRTSGKPKGAC